MLKDFLWNTVCDHLAAAHNDKTVGLSGFVHMVRDKDHRDAAFPIEGPDGFQYLPPANGVQHGGGLIQYHALWLHGQHTGNGDALFLSAGE